VEPDPNLGREDVLTMLGASPERVRDYVLGLDENRLDYRHGPAFPTLKEVVVHVCDAGTAADAALRHACLDGATEVAARAALETTAEPDVSVAADARLEDLSRVRRRTVDLLRGLTDQQWGQRFTDDLLGEIDILDFCRLIAAHEMGHLSQVRNLIALLPEP